MKSSRTLLIVALSVAFQVHAEGDGEGGQHTHDNFPPAVLEFHDVMAPIWHGGGGEERLARICESATRMTDLAGAIIEAPAPRQVDAAAWRQSAEHLRVKTVAVGEQCASDRTEGLVQTFSNVHDAFHSLVAHVGH